MSRRQPHVYLADVETGATRVITNSVRRGLANGASGKPKMSSDGRFVVFQSEASDLVAAEDFNLLWDVFVFDRTTDTMTRVSGDPEGVWMEPSGGPSIDARGSVVAFSSRHPTDASDKSNDFDLYVATLSELADWKIVRFGSSTRQELNGSHHTEDRKKEGDGPFEPSPHALYLRLLFSCPFRYF
jgi:Tol biopolymer transport system component